MKKVLAGLMLVGSLSAQAEVKPEGTIVPNLCGSTGTFPVNLNVCLASTEGRDSRYIVLTSYGELGREPLNVSYAKIDHSQNAIDGWIHKGTYVYNGMESLVELTVQHFGVVRGTLRINNQIVFGGESFVMEPVVTTEGAE